MGLGNGLLWFSLLVTGAGMLAYLPGLRGRRNPSIRYARWAVYLSAAGLAATLAYLWHLILGHQFQYAYIFRYSSREMPLRYVITSLWGGQEGTFLLWAAFAGLLAVFLRFKSRHYESAVEFFYMGITFFLLLMLTKASPFKLLDTVPADGSGLNPLLQDPWMTIHPPIMFFGFASLGIPAAYAMAALMLEDWDNWVPRALPWTLFGVLSLGVGLVLGGYWSYSILGWGGFWGWDPVENSSLVPWLFGITLIHTQIIQMRHGRFRKANLLLSILPFLFLTYSTFLTRSGVLADFSVHSFTDLGINQYLVAFMAVFLGGGVVLYLFKLGRIPDRKRPSPLLSREYFMFLRALVFGLFALFVALGTSAPLLSRIWGGIGTMEPEFYNRASVPFIAIVCVLMAVAPFLIWNRVNPGLLWHKVRWTAVLALGSAPLYFLAGIRSFNTLPVMVTATFALLANLQVAAVIARRNWGAAGGYLTHVGLALCVLGIVTSTAYDRKEVIELPQGKDVSLYGYAYRYLGSRPVEEGRKNAYDVRLSRGTSAYILSPTMFYSEMNAGMMKKPAIRSFLTHDIYVAPGGEIKEDVLERVSRWVVLHKGESAEVGALTFTFNRFDMSGGDHAEGGSMEIAAVVTVTDASGPRDVRLVFRPGNGAGGVPTPIPGTDLSATIEGLDANNGAIKLAVGSSPLILAPGESGSVQGMEFRLAKFDVDTGSGRGTKVGVYAMVDATVGGERLRLRPGLVERANMDPEYREAPIGDTGLNLVLSGVDTETRQARFYVAPKGRDSIWVEASFKPFIGLLWLGTGLVTLGLLVSTIFQGRLAGKTGRRSGNPRDRDRKRAAA